MRSFFFALLGVLLLISPVHAAEPPPEISANLNAPQQVGEARYSVLAINLFDASLWSADGAFAWDQPFVLSLTYLRRIRAQSLVNRTMSELEARGRGDEASRAALRVQLERCFTTVVAGDRVTAYALSAHSAQFYLNGAPRCSVEWPNFRRAFFGIWLEPRGSTRTFSERLLGQA